MWDEAFPLKEPLNFSRGCKRERERSPGEDRTQFREAETINKLVA